VLLEVLLGGSDELDGDKLVAMRCVRHAVIPQGSSFIPSLLESADDVANESTLWRGKCQCRVRSIDSLLK
jgi:hypothetical protein